MAAAARELKGAEGAAAVERLLADVPDTTHKSALERVFNTVRLQKGAAADLSYGGADDKYSNGVVQPFDKRVLKVITRWLESGVNVSALRLSYHPSVDDDTVTDLSDALKRNHFLDELSLYGTEVAHVEPLVAALKEHNNSLTKVNILSTPAAADPGQMAALYWSLAENGQPLRLKFLLPKVRTHDPTITTLDLDDRGGAKQYDDTSARFIVAAFTGVPVASDPFTVTQSLNRCVTELVLTNSAITVEGARLLASFLLVDKTLVKLDLSHSTQLKNGGVEALARALTPPQSNATLEELRLSYTGCGGERCAGVLAKMIAANEALQVVRLRGNNFPDAGRLFLKSKKVSCSLRVLDVADVGITPDLLEEIQDSPLLCDAPTALVAALPLLYANSLSMQTLDISWSQERGGCALNDSTLQFVLEALQGNDRVTSLDVSGSRVTYLGLRDLCNALASGTAAGLTTLKLRGLVFEPTAHIQRPTPAKLVADMLFKHAALTSVDLRDNQLEDNATDTIYDLATRRRSLRELLLDGTGVDAEVQSRIQHLLPLYELPMPFAELALFMWGPGVADGELDFSVAGEWWRGQTLGSPKMASPNSSLDFGEPENAAIAMDALCRILQGQKAITLINVADQPLGDTGARPLLDMLHKSPHMTGVRLSNTGITEASIPRLAEAVKRNAGITTAEVTRNDGVGDASVELVKAYLTFNVMPVNVKDLLIDIDDDALEAIVYTSDDPTDQLRDNWLCILVDAMLRVASKRPPGSTGRIAHLDFSNSYLSNAAFTSLTTLLQHPVMAAGIETIKLANCVFSGTQHLATFLEAAATAQVKVIDLSCNYLGNDGFKVARLVMDRFATLGEIRMHGDRGIEDAKQQIVDKELLIARDLNAHPHFKSCVNRLKKRDATLEVIKEAGANYNLCKVLCEVMHLSDGLRVIDLSHGTINDSGAGMVARGFRGNPSIHVLSLAHNKITVLGARLLASALESSTHLQRLDLSYNELDGRAVPAMVGMLNLNQSILEVSLAGNPQITAAQLGELRSALINDQPYLKAVLPKVRTSDVATTALDFSTTGHNDLTIERVCQGLLGNTAVETLNLSGHDLSAAGVKCLAEMLEVHAALEVLLLDRCGLDDARIAPLFASIKQNQGLKKLSLKGNAIQDLEGLIASLAVDGCNTLQQVDLEKTPVAKKYPLQVRALHAALGQNTVPYMLKDVLSRIDAERVVIIDLPGSERGGHADNSAATLANALPKCPTVRMVNLAGNIISGAGAEELADALVASPHLLRLDVSRNQIAADGLRSFRRNLKDCYTLKRLDVAGNPGCDDVKLLTHVEHLVAANAHPLEIKRWVVDGVDGNGQDTLLVNGHVSAAKFRTLNAGIADEDVARFGLPTLHPRVTRASLDLVCTYVTTEMRVVALPHHSLGCDAVLQILEATKNIEISTFNFRDNAVRDEGGVAISARVAASASATHVDLSQNNITDHTVARLLRVMRRPDRAQPEAQLVVKTRRNPRVTHTRQADVQLLNHFNYKSSAMKQLFVDLMSGAWGGDAAAADGGGTNNTADAPIPWTINVSGRAAGGYFSDTRPAGELAKLQAAAGAKKRAKKSRKQQPSTAASNERRADGGGAAEEGEDMNVTQPWLHFFLSFIERHPVVKGLDLSCNGVRDCNEVARYLCAAPALERLTLNDSPYIGTLAVPVLNAVAASLTLTHVSFEGCALTDAAVPLLTNVLASSGTLVYLNIVENELSTASVKPLAGAAPERLTHLMLFPSKGDMSEDAVRKVGETTALVLIKKKF